MKGPHAWIVLFFLSGCLAVPTPTPTDTVIHPSILVSADSPYGAQPEDTRLRRTTVVVNSISLIERFDLNPTRVEVNLLGSLPNTCAQLRVDMGLPNNQYQIRLQVYSVTNPNQVCENVLRQFQANVLLGVYSSGRYTVWVNEGLIGDFVTY